MNYVNDIINLATILLIMFALYYIAELLLLQQGGM